MSQVQFKKYVCFIAFILVTLSFTVLAPAHASGVKKILIIPFSFNSGEEGDLAFLQKGINRMLHTRLRHVNQTETIFPKAGDVLPSNPIEAGAKYQTDYVLTGSVTMFGEKISTDAIFYSVADKKEVLSLWQFLPVSVLLMSKQPEL